VDIITGKHTPSFVLIRIYSLKTLIRLTSPYYRGVVSLRIGKPKITCGRLCILLLVLIIVAPFVSAWWPRGSRFEEVTNNTPNLLWKANSTLPDSWMCSAAIGNVYPGIDTEVVSVEETWSSVGNRTIAPASCISVRRGDMGDLVWYHQFDTRGLSDVALGDLDHDGYSEVICAVEDTGVFAFKGNGSIYWLYPRNTLHISDFERPIVVDVLGNSRPEVIIPTTDGGIYVLNGTTGQLLWSMDMFLSQSPSLAVGDINGDSQREMVLNTGYYTYAFTVGNSTPIWIHKWTSHAGSAPIIADINGDGKADVVVETTKAVTALNGADGTVLWQHTMNTEVLSWACAVGDVSGDGQLEVVFTQGRDQICALHGTDGSLLWTYSGFETYNMGDLSIGDFDGDRSYEIVMSGQGSVTAINAEYGFIDWHYSTPSGEVEIQQLPAIGDINNNGRLDIVVPCTGYAGHLGLYAIEPLSSGSDLYWNGQGGTSNYTYTNCLEDTDRDCDGLSNTLEHTLGTNTSSRDSDGDSIPDAWEYFHGFNPLDPVVPWNEFVIFDAMPLATVTATMISILAVLIIAEKKRWIGKGEAESPPNVES
jgi:outer membrane protein assembly factor BamB